MMGKKREDCAHYGPDGKRYCPYCGARVAQQADECFACHARLDRCPSSRRWPLMEMLVLLLLVALAWGWWSGRGERTMAYARAFTATAERKALSTPTHTPTRTPTSTPTPTATPSPTPTPTPTPQIYKVQPNDTLAGIAAEFGITVERLAKANGIDVGTLLQVGQELRIPGPEGTPFPTPTPTPEGEIINYVVQEGDTLILVAERFGVSIETLIHANKLENPLILKPGTALIVPIGTPKPTPTPTPILTPTPTPGARYPAPIPILPPDGARFSGPDARVQLSWTPVGYLWPDERYRVTLSVGDATWTLDTSGTSLIVPKDLYEPIRSRGGRVRWQVQVVNVMVDPVQPQSAHSPARVFIWR